MIASIIKGQREIAGPFPFLLLGESVFATAAPDKYRTGNYELRIDGKLQTSNVEHLASNFQ